MRINVVNSSWRQKCIRFMRHWIIPPSVASQTTINTIAHIQRPDELNKKCMHFCMCLVWMHHMLQKSWVKNHYYKNENKERYKWVGYAGTKRKENEKEQEQDTNRNKSRQRCIHIRLKCVFGSKWRKIHKNFIDLLEWSVALLLVN